IDPTGPATGSVDVQLYSVTDLTGAVSIGGPPMTFTTTVPGQNIILTFAGTAGQRASISFSSSYGSYLWTYGTCILNVYSPGVSYPPLAGSGCASNWNPPFVDAFTLPATGTYTITINPAGPDTGAFTIQLWGVADLTGTIVVGGSPVNINFTTPGQNAYLTFAGTAGQPVTIQPTNSTVGTYYGDCAFSLRDPNNSNIGSGWCGQWGFG